MRSTACKKADPPVLVASYINNTSATWRVDRLGEFFLPMDIEVIQTIPICTRRIDDFFAWHYEKTGVFSVKSAYRMLVDTKRRREAWLHETTTSSTSEREEKDWVSLWKTHVPVKIRVFLWRLMNNSIPTGDVRFHRKMANDSNCSLCGAVDSWRHSLLECTMSRCVWALAPEAVVEHMDRTS